MVAFPGATLFSPDRFALELIQESCSDLAQSVCRDVLENAERFRFGGEAD